MKVGWYVNIGDLVGSAIAIVIALGYLLYLLIVERKRHRK